MAFRPVCELTICTSSALLRIARTLPAISDDLEREIPAGKFARTQIGQEELHGLELRKMLRDIGVVYEGPHAHKQPKAGKGDQIDEALEAKGLKARRQEILRDLYFATESGYFIRNGFRDREDDFQEYQDWVETKVGVQRDLDWEGQLNEVLNAYSREHGNRDALGQKNAVYEFFAAEKDFERIPEIRNEIESVLKEKGLFKDHMLFTVTENSIIISYYPFDKSIGIDFMNQRFADRKGNIIASGDNAQKGGLDHAMTSRYGGFSTWRFDENDPSEMIAIPQIAPKGLKHGVEMTVWAMRQIKHRRRKQASARDRYGARGATC